MNRVVICINKPEVNYTFVDHKVREANSHMYWNRGSVKQHAPCSPRATDRCEFKSKPIISSFPPYTGQPKARYLSTSM